VTEHDSGSIVRLSASCYVEYLRHEVLVDGASEAVRAAAWALVDSIEKARHGSSGDPSEIAFTASMLHEPASQDDGRQFVNQWSLGLGEPLAPVIVMGTEQAYEPDNLEGLALESCGSPILWLLDGGADVAAHLAGLPEYGAGNRRPYQRHPSDYYPIARRHTWNCVASAWAAACTIWATVAIKSSAVPIRLDRAGAASRPAQSAASSC